MANSKRSSRDSEWAGVHGHHRVLGTATVGERGQVVIPREAREELGIKPGDRFVIFGNKYRGTVNFIKADFFDNIADVMMSRSQKFEKLAKDIWEVTQEDIWDKKDSSKNSARYEGEDESEDDDDVINVEAEQIEDEPESDEAADDEKRED